MIRDLDTLLDADLMPRIMQMRLCALRTEIDNARETPNLSQDQQRTYKDAWEHWEWIYDTIFVQSRELGDEIGVKERDCCSGKDRSPNSGLPTTTRI